MEKINKMIKIAIVGAGGFGREVKMLIEQINSTNPRYDILGFYDDNLKKGTVVNGSPVLGSIKDLNATKSPISAAIAVGNPPLKKRLINQLNNPKISYPKLIHPSVELGITLDRIGKGVIIFGFTTITVDISIADFVSFNIGCIVGHDSIIGKFSAFMSHSNIAGNVVIGEGVYGGLGTKIINLVNIGNYVTLGAGSVVVRDLPSNCTAVGVPAKIINPHDET